MSRPRFAAAIRRRCIARVVACLLGLLGSRIAQAASSHPGASIFGEIVIEDDVVHLKIEGAADPFQVCLELPHLPIGPLEEDQVAANRAALERFVHDRLVVKIDDVEVEPTLLEVNVQEGLPEEASWRSTFIRLDYRTAGLPPSRLSLFWPRFEGEGVTYVSFVVKRGAKGSPRMYVVAPDEPEYVWHADDVRPRLSSQVKQVAATGNRIALPAPSLAALVFALVVLAFSSRAPRRAFGGFFVLLLVAYLARPYGRIDMPWPFGKVATLPAAAQAKDLFAALNGNVYRAFEAESESAIYDLLADSVAPELLDDLYGQIYESLLMREQNGAICSVEDIENVAGSVDLDALADDDPPAFKVDWRWRVFGSVSHWGHIHRRMNEYSADFVVRYYADGWKIAKIDVKEQQRVDGDG